MTTGSQKQEITADEVERNKLLAEAQECLHIITFQPGGGKYAKRKEARTKPNQRLVDVFGIRNVFTDATQDSTFSKSTIDRMKAICNMADHPEGDWTGLRERALRYFEEYMQSEKVDTHINLAELTQFITLKISLSYLFKHAESAFNLPATFDDIAYTARRINELWIESKKPDGELPNWKYEDHLRLALDRLTKNPTPMPGGFPTMEDMDDPNPLNFLLPAYETMWRVVMRCFMEVQLRGAENAPEWCLVLTEYREGLKSPDYMPKTFHNPSKAGIRPIDIAKEALRLYPPSRRVHRDFDGEIHRADIEARHRSKLLGGDDPLVFRPERWQNICPDKRAKFYEEMTAEADQAKRNKSNLKRGELELGFMPFATLCTADSKETKGFAMKMILLLVAVLCRGLNGHWELPESETLHVPLESGREAYGALRLKKI
ncbi:hypothetical protein BU23DRAFT_528435 [Bimuria novae-zelandiae CBS 107.79]|uniref:Cytochrome P450 n=1 Tax=Bimuria novae-zelandiae CBS 107.79 TaxID=1447943 RepID=A0A6A5VJS6_9PLEO|nr:hypothetical protein BU23DRAFT_528435 [Bimuria novae-zelandiae CBS 107.79]